MATHAPMARVPFAPLDNPRLQHLASLKNRQNGIISQKSSLKGKAGFTKSVLSPKRPYDLTQLDDTDGENVDPASLTSPSKKSKSDAFETPSSKTFTFSLTPSQLTSAPSAFRTSTPSRPSIASSRSPLTAPAGRSPKRKTAVGRRISAPFSRIDPPPSFGARGSSTLPFSLDAALHGTFSPACSSRACGSTIQESAPSSWFFDIYEDSAEDTAANLMEHSTSVLDLSSDEESSAKERNNVGKENMPPEDYDGPTASRSASDPAIVPQHIKKTEIVRKRILTADDMDDGQRSPLSDLETEPFIPAGLTRDSHVVVDASPGTSALKFDLSDLFAAPVPFTAGSAENKPADSIDDNKPVVDAAADVKEEIVVWQDDTTATCDVTESAAPAVAESVPGKEDEVLAIDATETATA